MDGLRLDGRLEAARAARRRAARSPSSSRRTARRGRGRPAGRSGTSKRVASCAASSLAPSSPSTGTSRPARIAFTTSASASASVARRRVRRARPRGAGSRPGAAAARGPGSMPSSSTSARAPRCTPRAPRPGGPPGRARASAARGAARAAGAPRRAPRARRRGRRARPSSSSASIRSSTARAGALRAARISVCAHVLEGELGERRAAPELERAQQQRAPLLGPTPPRVARAAARSDARRSAPARRGGRSPAHGVTSTSGPSAFRSADDAVLERRRSRSCGGSAPRARRRAGRSATTRPAREEQRARAAPAASARRVRSARCRPITSSGPRIRKESIRDAVVAPKSAEVTNHALTARGRRLPVMIRPCPSRVRPAGRSGHGYHTARLNPARSRRRPARRHRRLVATAAITGISTSGSTEEDEDGARRDRGPPAARRQPSGTVEAAFAHESYRPGRRPSSASSGTSAG